MPDKYDLAIEHFRSLGEDKVLEAEVIKHWTKPSGTGPGCLFQHLGEGFDRGCPTLIKSNPEDYKAPTEEMALAIRNDDLIPKRARAIKLDNLPVFAKYQRWADQIHPDRKGY